jgi:hypothetical protein
LLSADLAIAPLDAFSRWISKCSGDRGRPATAVVVLFSLLQPFQSVTGHSGYQSMPQVRPEQTVYRTHETILRNRRNHPETRQD